MILYITTSTSEVPYSSLKDEQISSGTLSTKINQLVGTMEYNDTVSMGKCY